MTQFFDTATISVVAGRGGAGSAWLRREKYVPHGGPAGGDGGRGGHVILRASTGENTLVRFAYQKRFAAESGGAGGRSLASGRQGRDMHLDVPCGTMVYDTTEDCLLGDLAEASQTLVAAAGGDGGIGNHHFKSSTRQTPRFALRGLPGEHRRLRLELKLVADVGLAGAPNAGKSSLLAKISAARPLVAAFPFSTVHPVLGVVRRGDSQLTFADVPGLIEGSHLGQGLGDEFLRHLERTRFLVQVVDLSGDSGDPMQTYESIRRELEFTPRPLDRRPYIVAANKMDTATASDAWPAFQAQMERLGVSAYPISAVTGEGVSDLLAAAFAGAAAAPVHHLGDNSGANLPVLRPGAGQRPTIVEQTGPGQFEVRGSQIETLIERVDFQMPEALEWFWRQLERAGAMRALRRAGAKKGDQVEIAGRTFQWHEP